MSTPLKQFFDSALIAELADDLGRAHPRLDRQAFHNDCVAGLDALELMARAAHIADAMRRHLPPRFADAAKVLMACFGPELSSTDSLGMAPFRYLPHSIYIGRYGLASFDTAMGLQYELTKRFTAEFSIRPFLVHHQQLTIDRLRHWAQDPNVHVRRLVSEGTRPRLPWAPHITAFRTDPTPVIALLDRLKDDPERYVQRSAANNINDIAKDHPDVAVALCRRWLVSPTPAREWIVGHALRSLVKRGHRDALDLMGAGSEAEVDVKLLSAESQPVAIGSDVICTFEVAARGSVAQTLQIDYTVHFVKANGRTRPKTFKLRRITLEPGQTRQLTAAISTRPMSTRNHYPGTHRIELLINGTPFELASFELRG